MPQHHTPKLKLSSSHPDPELSARQVAPDSRSDARGILGPACLPLLPSPPVSPTLASALMFTSCWWPSLLSATSTALAPADTTLQNLPQGSSPSHCALIGGGLSWGEGVTFWAGGMPGERASVTRPTCPLLQNEDSILGVGTLTSPAPTLLMKLSVNPVFYKESRVGWPPEESTDGVSWKFLEATGPGRHKGQRSRPHSAHP